MPEASKPRQEHNVKEFLKRILHPERHEEQHREDISDHVENEGQDDSNVKGGETGKIEAEQKKYEEEMKEDDKLKFTMG